VVVSPFARRNWVSSTEYDHTSILKLIERKWNLPPLTERDAVANDPLDMVDLGQRAFGEPPDLPPPAVPWPAPALPVSRRVRAAQKVGLVGRNLAPPTQ